jgi:hypothetical protein
MPFGKHEDPRNTLLFNLDLSADTRGRTFFGSCLRQRNGRTKDQKDSNDDKAG